MREQFAQGIREHLGQFSLHVLLVFATGLTIGYLQVERAGVEGDTAGLLSDPVDEGTVHFGRGQRDCAREARDAILERAGGGDGE